MKDKPHVPKHPCRNGAVYSCPWVKATPPGEFPEERYELLRSTSVSEDGYGPSMGDPMFACHKAPEGKEWVCAGWLASQGDAHPGVRWNVAVGAFPRHSLRPGDGWPELFMDYEEMKTTQEAKRADVPRTDP